MMETDGRQYQSLNRAALRECEARLEARDREIDELRADNARLRTALRGYRKRDHDDVTDEEAIAIAELAEEALAMRPEELWTDYPMAELGDEEGVAAPIRPVTVHSYDGDKYCRVTVCGIEKEIKSGYIYTEPKRADSAQRFDPEPYTPPPESEKAKRKQTKDKLKKGAYDD